MHGQRVFDGETVNLYEAFALAQAREKFAAFRRMMRPDMLWGWWTEEVAWQLQWFYNDLVAGRRPKLALMAHPQSGKSWTTLDFIAWVAGCNPAWRTIFASYSDDLGTRTNIDLQRMLTSEKYKRIFPNSKAGTGNLVCNTTLIEYGESGSFRNTTVNGAITGLSLNLGVIDDPVKNRQEAQSKTIRDRTWEWYLNDFMTRFHKDAGQLVVMTRWHTDDLLGRALDRHMGFKVLRYPAIAERDGRNRKKGEALFPEWKPLDFLLERRKVYSQASWESLYQQTPIVVGGGELPVENLVVLKNLDRSLIRHSIRSWDKACLIAGTLITTNNGYIPIEKIKAGDQVLTRVGFCRVKDAWMTKRTEEITSVLFSNGMVLSGTPDHLVFTRKAGWAKMACLKANHQLVREPSWGVIVRLQKKDSFKVDATLDIQEQKIKISNDTSYILTPKLENPDLCIETYGNQFTDLFPKAIMSTTRTMTGIKTTLTILSAYRQQSIVDCTELNLNLRKQLESGMLLRTPKKFAPWLLPILISHAKLFAQTAKNELSFEVSKQSSVRDQNVDMSVSVYDISVEGQHEFFANGILVHNCTTSEDASYTVGCLMHMLSDGRFVIEHVARGQWTALERERRIKTITEADAASLRSYEVVIEQEPGSGGKESAESTIRMLAGHRVKADKVTGSKEVRAEPFVAQVQGSNVFLLAGEWVIPFLDECESWPGGKHNDQVDAAASAFNHLAPALNFDSSYSGFQILWFTIGIGSAIMASIVTSGASYAGILQM